jgi:endonuclease/exonuclease/phosphatase family metal-dependent hydrolase
LRVTSATLSVTTFNCQWRRSKSAAAAEIRRAILATDPEIVCLTEAYLDFFGDEGFVIEADADYGYPITAGRRKVLLWSRQPWSMVDSFGHANLPPGRFVCGTTQTSIGALAVIGVCIPWSAAHVSSGRRDQTLWAEHLDYLSAIGTWLPAVPARQIVLGDFNQRVPRKRQPEIAFAALQAAILSRMEIATAHIVSSVGEPLIDHICHSRDLVPRSCAVLTNIAADGSEISDHVGVNVQLSLNIS